MMIALGLEGGADHARVGGGGAPRGEEGFVTSFARERPTSMLRLV